MTNDKPAWIQLKQAARLRTIVLLQGMIRRLQWVVDRLDPHEGDESTIADAAPPLFPALWAWLRSLGQGGLRGLRARLPIAWNRRLSDGALAGMVVATIALLAGVTITLAITPSGSQPAQIAINPEPPSITAPTTTPTITLTDVPLPSPSSSLPSPQQFPSPEPSPEGVPDSSPEAFPSPSPSVPPVRSPGSTEFEQPAPSPTQPSPSAEADPTDPSVSTESTIALVSDQPLVASIQAQLTTAIAALIPDPSRLIQLLDPDYADSRLRVQIDDRWYGLEFTQQEQIAEALREQATELSFSDLDLVDAQGATIARSPVVGDRMIILKRRIQTPS